MTLQVPPPLLPTGALKYVPMKLTFSECISELQIPGLEFLHLLELTPLSDLSILSFKSLREQEISTNFRELRPLDSHYRFFFYKMCNQHKLHIYHYYFLLLLWLFTFDGNMSSEHLEQSLFYLLEGLSGGSHQIKRVFGSLN